MSEISRELKGPIRKVEATVNKGSAEGTLPGLIQSFSQDGIRKTASNRD